MILNQIVLLLIKKRNNMTIINEEMLKLFGITVELIIKISFMFIITRFFINNCKSAFKTNVLQNDLDKITLVI